jgi:inhibitor of KinA
MCLSVYISKPRFLLAGESCLVAEFADEISREANDVVAALGRELTVQKNVRIIECMPTYRSLAVYFDPLVTSREALEAEMKRLLSDLSCSEQGAHRVISVPVCYGGSYGPDIQNVADHAQISVEEVIKRHSARVCHCFMIGFVPGFAYLGGMDESIATPRLANPRTVIEAGSVGIAGKQTGIYPIASPGGWQLIGRTPLRLFTPEAARPTLIEAGCDVRFEPIAEAEYNQIAAEVEAGTYKPKITEAA